MGEKIEAGSASTAHLAGLFALWYFSSFITLFSNKYILLDPNNDAVILGELLLTLICYISVHSNSWLTCHCRLLSNGHVYTVWLFSYQSTYWNES